MEVFRIAFAEREYFQTRSGNLYGLRNKYGLDRFFRLLTKLWYICSTWFDEVFGSVI